METEHILPRAEFFFDSYLNIVPACPRCNQSKGARTPSAASLKIADEAYEAYSSYLQKKSRTRPLHLFHTIKKGVLNLMRDPQRQWEAERYLSLIASQFAQHAISIHDCHYVKS
jgi:type III secretory pathway component EscR